MPDSHEIPTRRTLTEHGEYSIERDTSEKPPMIKQSKAKIESVSKKELTQRETKIMIPLRENNISKPSSSNSCSDVIMDEGQCSHRAIPKRPLQKPIDKDIARINYQLQ